MASEGDADEVAHALARAAGFCRLSGDAETAELLYSTALEARPGWLEAHLGLAELRMTGPGYYEILTRLHARLEPALYLEIGMGDGSSMALARPPTRAVGVDPVPHLDRSVAVECTVCPQTSSEFFARDDLDELFGGAAPDFVFIDGLHTFPAVLSDFIGAESLSASHTVVALHDTVPFDEATQRPDRVHDFYTGDVWKLLPCLATTRPDLRMLTIRTPPSGLTLVAGLDASSTVLRDRRDALVDQFGQLPFDPSLSCSGDVGADQWDAVLDWLDA